MDFSPKLSNLPLIFGLQVRLRFGVVLPLLQTEAAGCGVRRAAGWCRLAFQRVAMEQIQHRCRRMNAVEGRQAGLASWRKGGGSEILVGLLEMGVVPRIKIMLNSNSLSGGIPGSSSGNTSGNSQTTGLPKIWCCGLLLADSCANLSEERKKARIDPRPIMQPPRPMMMHGRGHPRMPPPRPIFSNQPNLAPKCGKCGKGHATRDCMKGSGACFNCGRPGHHKINCHLSCSKPNKATRTADSSVSSTSRAGTRRTYELCSKRSWALVSWLILCMIIDSNQQAQVQVIPINSMLL